MELFPAANEDQWTLIKRVIDDCDYYIVIIAGRGSLGPSGISYTEMEYRYAIEKGKPVIAFVHKDPGKLAAERTEKTEEAQKKLAAFRELAQKKLVKQWASPADLGSKVSRSLVHLIKMAPSTGWVRSDQAMDEGSAKEILRLKGRIEQLELQLNQARTAPPPGTEKFSQGSDTFEFRLGVTVRKPGEYSDTNFAEDATSTWNEIFAFVSPMMIDELSEDDFGKAVDNFAHTYNVQRIKGLAKFKNVTGKRCVGVRQ